jgi:hypothetical protein
MQYRAFVLFTFLGTALAADQPDPNFDSIYKPAKDEAVPAGKSYVVAWTAPTSAPKGTVTITLYGGTGPTTLQSIKTIGSKYQDSAFLLVI